MLQAMLKRKLICWCGTTKPMPAKAQVQPHLRIPGLRNHGGHLQRFVRLVQQRKDSNQDLEPADIYDLCDCGNPFCWPLTKAFFCYLEGFFLISCSACLGYTYNPPQGCNRHHQVARITLHFSRRWNFIYNFVMFTPTYLGKMDPIWTVNSHMFQVLQVGPELNLYFFTWHPSQGGVIDRRYRSHVPIAWVYMNYLRGPPPHFMAAPPQEMGKSGPHKRVKELKGF